MNSNYYKKYRKYKSIYKRKCAQLHLGQHQNGGSDKPTKTSSFIKSCVPLSSKGCRYNVSTKRCDLSKDRKDNYLANKCICTTDTKRCVKRDGTRGKEMKILLSNRHLSNILIDSHIKDKQRSKKTKIKGESNSTEISTQTDPIKTTPIQPSTHKTKAKNPLEAMLAKRQGGPAKNPLEAMLAKRQGGPAKNPLEAMLAKRQGGPAKNPLEAMLAKRQGVQTQHVTPEVPKHETRGDLEDRLLAPWKKKLNIIRMPSGAVAIEIKKEIRNRNYDPGSQEYEILTTFANSLVKTPEQIRLEKRKALRTSFLGDIKQHIQLLMQNRLDNKKKNQPFQTPRELYESIKSFIEKNLDKGKYNFNQDDVQQFLIDGYNEARPHVKEKTVLLPENLILFDPSIKDKLTVDDLPQPISKYQKPVSFHEEDGMTCREWPRHILLQGGPLSPSNKKELRRNMERECAKCRLTENPIDPDSRFCKECCSNIENLLQDIVL